jgi:hypothetical protein
MYQRVKLYDVIIKMFYIDITFSMSGGRVLQQTSQVSRKQISPVI